MGYYQSPMALVHSAIPIANARQLEPAQPGPKYLLQLDRSA